MQKKKKQTNEKTHKQHVKYWYLHWTRGGKYLSPVLNGQTAIFSK